jgi:sugar O-acyltransferase (sialic acid O-acetyltransferase NeuD family)
MDAPTRVAVLGAGGHGKVVLDALIEECRRDVVAILDDDPARSGGELLGISIVGGSVNLAGLARRFRFTEVVVAIGDNYVRERKSREVCRAGLELATVVHPSARVSRFAKIGHGVVILAGAVVNPGTEIADYACVNTSASIDHDNQLGTACHVFPNATLAGGVRVGHFAYIGSGAVINPNRSVGDYSYVGAGAVVTEDVAEGWIVAGVPAKQIGTQTKRRATDERE